MTDETEIPETPEAEVAADPRDVEIITLKDEVANSKDRLLHLAAEMDNLRKRTDG